MSDTDDDLVQPIYHTHACPLGKTVHSQTCNVNKIRYEPYNNIMATNFNMPNRFMNFDQRSMRFRKETSPMSLRSFPDSRMQYQQPYSHNSGYNAKYRAPASVQSISSNVSLSTADLITAIKNGKHEEPELLMLMDCIKKRVKKMNRNGIEKRRNLKSFIKQCRKNSDGGSGAEASNSSMSSDDCRSTRSAFYSRNIPKNQVRPLGMDLKRLTTQVSENATYKGTENFKQNSFKNLLTEQSRNVNHSFMTYNNQNIAYNNKNLEAPGPHQEHCNDTQNAPIVLKNRLVKDTSVLLPIQRFNISSVNQSYKVTYKEKTRTAPLKETISNVNLEPNSDDSDEIFTQSISTVNLTNSNALHQKRVLEDENINYPESKRKKSTTSPVNQSKRASTKNTKKIIAKTKDFNFKKPLLPISRSSTLPRNKEQEILIAKSSQPLIGNVEPLINQLKEINNVVITSEENSSNKQMKKPPRDHIDTLSNDTVDTAHNSTNVSMKPSFIKRKLFTQKLDILDSNNISSDSGEVNSPQTKSQRACSQKNKVRKLTSQSCLNRDVSDNNYLDLIHKLVPHDQINNQTVNKANEANQKKTTQSSLEKDGKWDVSLAVSMCSHDNTSDVYTDEEIFDVPQKDKESTKQVTKEPHKVPVLAKALPKAQIATASTCKVVLQKITGTSGVTNNSVQNGKQYMRTAKSCVKTFWETDFETDAEDTVNLSSQETSQRHQMPRGSAFLNNGDSVVANARGTIIRSTQNICNPNVNNDNETKKTQSSKGKMHDKLHENKENDNDNIQNKTTRKNNEANMKKDMKILKSTQRDTNKLSNNSHKSLAKNQNNKTKTQNSCIPKTSFMTKQKQSETVFNISRESLRQRKNRSVIHGSVPQTCSTSLTSNDTKSTMGNTSRESLRLKQKKEAQLNGKKKCEFKKRFNWAF